MPLSPQRIRETNFKSSRRGYDPAEVDAFVDEVAAALESAQNDATAMEARARAAVARLQEISQAGAESAEPVAAPPEAETISRTLLLAQRTADTTVAEARTEADRLLDEARRQAATQLDAAREESTRVLDEARAEARRAGESERVQVEGEVQALLARRDFLESDVDHLEQHLVAQRERITEAAAALTDLAQRAPGGLGDVRRPLLSASADEDFPAEEEDGAVDDDLADDSDGDATGDAADDESEIAEISRVAGAATVDQVDEPDDADVGDVEAIDELFEQEAAGDHTPSSAPLFDGAGNPTGSSERDR